MFLETVTFVCSFVYFHFMFHLYDIYGKRCAIQDLEKIKLENEAKQKKLKEAPPKGNKKGYNRRYKINGKCYVSNYFN
jgi:hypothetical protein